MYEVKASSKKDFLVKAWTDENVYIMDKSLELGTTPVGVLLASLSACTIMCVRGYYLKQGIKELLIETQIKFNYESEININLKIDKEVSEDEKPSIIAHVKKYCTVSQMLREDIKINFVITGK